MKVDLKAKVAKITKTTVYLEFGSVQAGFEMSARGLASRKMRLKEGDAVKVSLEKL